MRYGLLKCKKSNREGLIFVEPGSLLNFSGEICCRYSSPKQECNGMSMKFIQFNRRILFSAVY